jgi:hypothetical protein
MTEDITIKEILEDKRFREMSLDELAQVINCKMFSADYMELEGRKSMEKTKILMEKFKREKEIVGYKLKENFDIEEFKLLTKNHFFNSKEFEEKGNLGDYNNFLTHIKKMGVLELWFTPVYKEEVVLAENKWYKDAQSNSLYFIENIKDQDEPMGKVKSFGFNKKGLWSPSCNRHFNVLSKFKPASDKEVEAALSIEATKRGLVKGAVYVYPERKGFSSRTCGNSFYYTSDLNGLYDDFKNRIFRDGIWAEVIEKEEDKFKDFEHTDERYVTYKGYDFEESFIKNPDFEYITSMNVKFDNKKFMFSKADISLIKEYVKEKL